MGLAFLEDRILTVDINKERLWVESDGRLE